jgi:predicted nucleic acid-binding protein
MPSRSGSTALVDTSVAVPLVVADHPAHRVVMAANRGSRWGLAGHAAFETFSVLTRLPPPGRRGGRAVQRLLSSNFPATRFLDGQAASDLLARLPDLDIAGGAVYDALVGATAAHHGLLLVTRDRRAADTYRALDVRFDLLE